MHHLVLWPAVLRDNVICGQELCISAWGQLFPPLPCDVVGSKWDPVWVVLVVLLEFWQEAAFALDGSRKGTYE